MPLATLRGMASCVGTTSAWISTSIGRVPSKITVTADPGTFFTLSCKKRADGLDTSFSPSSAISKIPTSSIAPNRFLRVRRILALANRSPSRYRTASTMCSSTLGPAIAPSFVTCPMMIMGMPWVLAAAMRISALWRICPTDPAIPSKSEEESVCMESTMTKLFSSSAASAPTMFSALVSERMDIFSPSIPSRFARSFTCSADSSPDT